MSLLLLFGCLPHTALSRHAELPSARYHLDCQVHTVTTGAAVPAFDWNLQAELDLGYTRTFRDHSIGTLVQFTEVSASVDGRPAPSELKGLLVELRSFDRGEVLALSGADAGVGRRKHLEVMDVLWPALVPRVEIENNHLRLLTSWPVGDSWKMGRTHLQGEGDFARGNIGTELNWTGTVSQEDPTVQRHGTVQVRTTVDDRNARTHSSTWVVEEDVLPQWKPGLQQHQRIELRLTYQGPAAPLPIGPPPEQDSRYADMLPLVLTDGRALQHPEVNVNDALPFLLFPDNWSQAEITAVLGG